MTGILDGDGYTSETDTNAVTAKQKADHTATRNFTPITSFRKAKRVATNSAISQRSAPTATLGSTMTMKNYRSAANHDTRP